MKAKKTIIKCRFILLLIIIFGFLLRIIGLKWDQSQHLHPDERFLSMVIADIKIPQTLSEYLNPQVSSLNPYNNGYDFFVYGSFPVNLTKIISQFLNSSDYDYAYLVGRCLTIILDSLVIVLIFLITTKIAQPQIALIAAFLYSICVLPIQISHFFTVDPFLNFFIILAFYFLISLQSKKYRLKNTLFLSLSFGFALASKISAVFFSPVILFFFIFNFKKDLISFLKYGLIFLILSLCTFRFFQPQVFIDNNYFNWQPNPQFVKNLKELKTWDKNPYYPPAIQWIKVTPIIFPLKNMVLWGLGLPFGIIFLISFVFNILKLKKDKDNLILSLVTFWILFLFLFQGSQSVSTMRYFLPIYPFVCIISGIFINYLFNTYFFKKYYFLKYLFFILLTFYPISFLSIFLKKHTRVNASEWIYQYIPKNSNIATEYWDDPLPLSVGDSNYSVYQFESLHVADVESSNLSKISDIKKQLDKSDYLILSSNRFYLPIPQNSDLFPQTANYYHSLFNETLGFKKIAEFTSYPCFPPIGKAWFCFNDINSEEAFTVYDHPKVIIFQKVSRIDQ